MEKAVQVVGLLQLRSPPPHIPHEGGRVNHILSEGGVAMKHTELELWRDDAGFIAAGYGDDYFTMADFDCSGEVDIAEREANKDRFIALFNAAKMPTEDAVKYLEHGAEMVDTIVNWICKPCLKCKNNDDFKCKVMRLLAKLEAPNDKP